MLALLVALAIAAGPPCPPDRTCALLTPDERRELIGPPPVYIPIPARLRGRAWAAR